MSIIVLLINIVSLLVTAPKANVPANGIKDGGELYNCSLSGLCVEFHIDYEDVQEQINGFKKSYTKKNKSDQWFGMSADGHDKNTDSFIVNFFFK